MTWLYLLIAVVAEVAGTLALKASASFSKPGLSAMVLACYGVAFYFLSLTLKDMSVGLAYAIWSGVGIVLITWLSFMLFQQQLDWPALVGIAFILAGVLVIQLFSKTIIH